MSWGAWALLACGPAPMAPAPAPAAVWVDADTSAGLPTKDVDDAWAIALALRSPELEVVGISAVFGNASLDEAAGRGAEAAARAGRPMEVYLGADGAGARGPTPASEALIRALEARPLHILALGPLTNLAAVLELRPDLAPRVGSVVAVMGRLPDQRLQTGEHVHRDFNLEQDEAAAAAVLAAEVPVVLAPWALSRQVWIRREELARLAAGSPPGPALAETSASWLSLWTDRFGVDGFNPFDTLAVGLLARPDLIGCEAASAALVRAPDDRPGAGAERPEKPYLIVRPGGAGRAVRWCDQVDAVAFRAWMLGRLGG